ncbi:MAG: TrmH family RNA methyltransferase [Bacteroidales bacterium]
MEEKISSVQNQLVKNIARLQQKSSERRKSGMFVAEGRREVSLALSSGIQPVYLLICPDIYLEDPAYPLPGPDPDQETHPVTTVSRAVYNKLAYRRDAEGVMLVAKQENLSPEKLSLPESPLLLVIEGVEKPGNLGAILRTADAAGVDALILTDSRTDLYNPNAIRSSLGCLFTVPVARCSNQEAIHWLTRPGNWKGAPPEILSAILQTSIPYDEADMTGAVALVFGAEDKGVSEAWRAASHQHIRIPMAGRIDSLNLAASAAILTFEAVRQRKQKAAGRSL